MDWTILGLLAGAITSTGFIPQLVRGFRTKKLHDVSYFMPVALIAGTQITRFHPPHLALVGPVTI